MRVSSLAKIMIGIENIVVKDVSFDEDAQAIVIDAKAPLLQMRQVRAEGPPATMQAGEPGAGDAPMSSGRRCMCRRIHSR
ncbi:hypothetical protein [Atopobium sp. oral taxon 416]|uniref:hypothetical protein n=1 Tax=Atopobium sp. oral taxon 416 TaxID=712157 RepID=UPI001BADC7A0|nr:hypothetical protein [Atopobium sp. oral taxon 416]QUC03921.1 hypothetical protein J4859_02935 [Atopobium sp. oral taxon 416]